MEATWVVIVCVMCMYGVGTPPVSCGYVCVLAGAAN